MGGCRVSLDSIDGGNGELLMGPWELWNILLSITSDRYRAIFSKSSVLRLRRAAKTAFASANSGFK